jgi:hypothetical protein
MLEFLASNDITVIPHPQYSVGVAPCDLNFFLKLRKPNKLKAVTLCVTFVINCSGGLVKYNV